MRQGTIRTCAQCGAEFRALYERGSFKRKFCSRACTADYNHARAVATYPPREEIVRLYVDEGMSDRALGRHYGRSYQWSLGVRRHYGIPGHQKGKHSRKPLAEQRPRARFHIGLKREDACRNCGAEGVVLHLHHAVPRSLAPAGRFDLRNGVPLCAPCHFSWHGGTPISRDIFTAEEWAFIETLIGPGWLARKYPRKTKAAA